MRLAPLLVLATLVALVASAHAGGPAKELPTGRTAVVRFQGKVARNLEGPGRFSGNGVITAATGHITIEGDQARVSFHAKKPGWKRIPFFGWHTITQTGRVTERGPNLLRVTIADSIANRDGMQANIGGGAGIRSSEGSLELRMGPSSALQLKFVNNLSLSVPGYGGLGLTMTFEGDDLELR